MTLDERFEATKGIADPVARKLARTIIQTEWEIEDITKRLEVARKRVEDAAARESATMYADRVKDALRDWQSKHAQLASKNHALRTLKHIVRAAEREDACS